MNPREIQNCKKQTPTCFSEQSLESVPFINFRYQITKNYWNIFKKSTYLNIPLTIDFGENPIKQFNNKLVAESMFT